jgi:hypothetical protein
MGWRYLVLYRGRQRRQGEPHVRIRGGGRSILGPRWGRRRLGEVVDEAVDEAGDDVDVSGGVGGGGC